MPVHVALTRMFFWIPIVHVVKVGSVQLKEIVVPPTINSKALAELKINKKPSTKKTVFLFIHLLIRFNSIYFFLFAVKNLNCFSQVFLGFLVVLQLALRDYFANFKLNLIFGVLLIFSFIALFENIFVSSGSIFLEYNLFSVDLFILFFQLIAIIVFLVFYSLFVSFLIFNVRNKMNKVRLNYYLSEKLHKFSFSLALFFALYFLIFYFLYSLLVFVGLPLLLINLFLFLVSLLLLFVPQSIVVDESRITHGIQNSIEFLIKNPLTALKVILLSFILLLVLPLIESLFDFVFLIGNYISLLLALFFVVPFIEIVKTRLYMKKFGLVLFDKD